MVPVKLTLTQLKALPQVELIRRFHASNVSLDDRIEEVAKIWVALRDQYGVVFPLDPGQAMYFPAIANSQMRGSLLVKYGGQPYLLGRLAALPIEDQDKLLASYGKLQLKTPRGIEDRNLLDLKVIEVDQVLEGDQLRLPIEQTLPKPIAPKPVEVSSPEPSEPTEDYSVVLKVTKTQRAALEKLGKARKMSTGDFIVKKLSVYGII